VATLADNITKRITQARTVTSSTPQVSINPKRMPKDGDSANDNIVKAALQIDTLQNQLKQENTLFKEQAAFLKSTIDESAETVKHMLESKNTQSQKINVRDNKNEEPSTYFVRLKDSKETAARPKDISSDGIYELLTSVIAEIFQEKKQELSAGGGGRGGLGSLFVQNRDAIIKILMLKCEKTREQQQEEDEATDDQPPKKKLCFDKSTGSRARNSSDVAEHSSDDESDNEDV
jgi:hypothetical protein